MYDPNLAEGPFFLWQNLPQKPKLSPALKPLGWRPQPCLSRRNWQSWASGLLLVLAEIRWIVWQPVKKPPAESAWSHARKKENTFIDEQVSLRRPAGCDFNYCNYLRATTSLSFIDRLHILKEESKSNHLASAFTPPHCVDIFAALYVQ